MTNKRKHLSASRLITIISSAVFALLAIVLIITNVFIPVKYLGTYFFYGSEKLESVADVTFIDVGYGEAIVVRFPDGKVMLIGGGSNKYKYRCKVFQQLNKMGIDYIDWLVCPSVNGEHCGGLAEVVKYKQIGTIYYPYCNIYITDEYQSFYAGAVESGAQMTVYEYGVGAYGDDYFFSFLSPSAHTGDGEYADLSSSQTTETKNAISSVLWLEISGVSFLFCADATQTVMTKICENYLIFSGAGDDYAPQGGYSVRLDDLNVAEAACHGGSASAVFYDYAKPDYTIISVGENTSGYPTAAATSTICAYSQTLSTQDSGTIKITVADGGYAISKENS